jgi:predicted nucleotidyltransferase component of viral defense system
MGSLEPLLMHEDKDLFREALEFSAARTGFPGRLIEKDYYCTLLLQHLTQSDDGLVFKGGTCLAKIHTSFYRLSEDLDFSISTPADVNRKQRSRRVLGLKEVVKQINAELPHFKLLTALTGANKSTQYTALLEYTSILISPSEKIKIEVGLREPILQAIIIGNAHTLLLNPITETQMLPAILVNSLSWEEAMAEKFRAALTRREPAIRDFYDIFYAISSLDLSIQSHGLVELVRAKIAMPGNEDIDISNDKLEFLRTQIDTELEPVLRSVDFSQFNLEWTFSQLRKFASLIA